MTHINFLEKRGFDFRRIEFNYLLILVACGALLFSMIAYGLVQKLRLDSLRNQWEAKRSQREAMQGLKQQDLSPETPSSLSSIAPEKRIIWFPILNGVAAKTNPRVWIQSLSGQTGSRSIELEGGGAHWQAVSQFEKELKSLGSLGEVSLLSSETGPEGNIVFKMRGVVR